MRMGTSLWAWFAVPFLAFSALAGPYQQTALERMFIDLRPKDAMGVPQAAPETVDASLFKVTAQDVSDGTEITVPVQVIHYDGETGTAEIIFPLKKGYLYSVQVDFPARPAQE